MRRKAHPYIHPLVGRRPDQLRAPLLTVRSKKHTTAAVGRCSSRYSKPYSKQECGSLLWCSILCTTWGSLDIGRLRGFCAELRLLALDALRRCKALSVLPAAAGLYIVTGIMQIKRIASLYGVSSAELQQLSPRQSFQRSDLVHYTTANFGQ